MRTTIIYILSMIIVSAAVYQRITFGVADTTIVLASIPAMFYLMMITSHQVTKLRRIR